MQKASPPPRQSPPDAPAGLVSRAEAAIATGGLTHLVVGVYVLISASVWWFGAYKEFNFGHGPNGEDVWQRWPIAYVPGGRAGLSEGGGGRGEMSTRLGPWGEQWGSDVVWEGGLGRFRTSQSLSGALATVSCAGAWGRAAVLTTSLSVTHVSFFLCVH